jgi:hypothetical protein
MKIIISVLVMSIFFVSCDKGQTTDQEKVKTKHIAKDALAVVKIQSFNKLKESLPSAMQGQLGMANGMLLDLNADAELTVVLASLNPISAYAVIPYKESMVKLLVNVPKEMSAKAVDVDGVVILPLQGDAPTEFANYKGLMNKNIIEVVVNANKLQSMHGEYINKVLTDQIKKMIPLLGPGQEETKILAEVLNLEMTLFLSALKESESISMSYNKSKKYNIQSSWEFKKDSGLATIANDMGRRFLPTTSELQEYSIYGTFNMDYSQYKDYMEPMAETLNALYKTMGMDFDIKKMMEIFADLGVTEGLMGMDMSMDMSKRLPTVNSLLRAPGKPALLKRAIEEMMPEMLKMTTADKSISFKKSVKKFKGNDIYVMKQTIEGLNKLESNTMMSLTDKGFLQAEDEAGLEKMYKLKLSPSSVKGTMKLTIDMSKIAMPGISPIKTIINMLFTGSDNTMKMDVSF